MKNEKTETKNGVVPKLRFPEFRGGEEWEMKNLEQLGKFVRGLTYGSSDVADSGLLVLRSSNIQDGELVLDKDLVFVSKSCPPELTLKQGDIVICMSNGSKTLVGKNAEYQGNYDRPITVGAFCSIYRPATSFVKFIFQTERYQKFVAFSIGGGNINNLKNSDLEVYIGTIPATVLEQSRIADCLSSLDSLIAAHSQKLDGLKSYKKGLMQRLFPAKGKKVPNLRFPEFRKSGEWEEKDLESICASISSGKDKIDAIGSFDLYGSTGIIGKTSSCTYNGTYLLAARVGANAGLLTKARGSFGVTDNTLVINLNISENVDFVYYSLELIGLNKMVFGSGQPLITGTQLKSLSVSMPNREEQSRVTQCVSSIDNLINAQSQKIESLKIHKKGLMQQLFPAMGEANA